MSLLLLASGMRYYTDTFDVLSGVWQPVAGTLAVSGGGLRGATMGDFGANRITNGEFTSDVAGWGTYRHSAAQRDSAVEPGTATTASGAADDGCLRAERVDPADFQGNVNQSIDGYAAGRRIRAACLAYTPDLTHPARLEIAFRWGGGVEQQATANTWQALAITGIYGASGGTALQCRINTLTAGSLAYFDRVEAYFQHAAAILAPWRSPNFVTTLQHRSPAAGVVPFGWLFRRTNDLNYWELRVLPNTAGNDLQIIQVTAGVETVRAEADIDWTTNAVDEIELSVIGQNITTAHRKSGAAVWTAGPSYATATQGQTQRGMGPLFYGVDQNRLDAMEVVGR
jgi:hypothetical protein